MDDPFLTPVQRAGPTSRMLRRKSGLANQEQQQPTRTSKDINIERSLRMLDDALQSPNVSHSKPSLDLSLDTTRRQDITRMADVTRLVDITRFGGDDLRTRNAADLTRNADITRMMDITSMEDATRQVDITRMGGNGTIANMSQYVDGVLEENPGVRSTESLFDEFQASISSEGEGLDNIAEFEQLVGDHIHNLRRVVVNLPSGRNKYPGTTAVLQELINERNTWRIMGKLYTDRLVTCARAPADLPAPAPGSEKQIIERFVSNNNLVRQACMVVEWLERNAQDDNEEKITQQMEWFTDATISWENTTNALSRGQAGPHLIKELDPDAPHRTGLQLHDLDQQDEFRLITCVYALMRGGLLEDAQELCIRLGQPWRAATLEGWKLFHDPNYQSGTNGRGDKLPVEGNVHRDIWKKVAWGLTNDSTLSQTERSIYAALCGNLKQLRGMASSWEDRLWAGAKCAVDVMVETEIRQNLVKNFAELPTEYWNTPTSLSKVLTEAAGEAGIKNLNIYNVIQSHLILDDYPALLKRMAEVVRGGGTEPHLLRLMAHVVLVNRTLGVHSADQEEEEYLLVEYTRYLMQEDKLNVIPWYVSRLRPEIQLPLFSNFLAGVVVREDQQLCLHLGRSINIDMDSIIVAAVVTVRSAPNVDNEEMVGSLKWLTHEPSQAPDLLYQTNAVIRRLLGAGQIELAGKAAGSIPTDTMTRVVRAWREEDAGETSLPGGSVKEHLALKVYLDAQDAFSDWFDHFHRGQPKRPVLPENPSFTDKVAHEQREKQFLAELERWRGGQVIQSRHAEEKLREVLNFPGGWLVEPQDEGEMLDESETVRLEEMKSLRGEILPQTVLLLHSVLHNTGQFKACLELASLVTDESTRNYAAFSTDKIKQILAKLRESSLAVMEEGRDPWGFQKP